MSDYTNIPEFLQERAQYLYWNSSNTAPRAPLARPTASRAASWSDPDEWVDFPTAVANAEQHETVGIGYVNAIDNDDYPRGLVGSIDIDGAADADGHARDWVPSLEPFFEREAYIEWSPSGTGLRIPVIGLDTPEWWSDFDQVDGEHKGVEVLTNKFSTYTGDQLRGAGDEAIEYGDWLDDWLREVHKAITGEDPLAERDPDVNELGEGAQARDFDGDEWLTPEVAADALDAIDPDCGYDTWKDIGMALVNHLGRVDGGSLFKRWSRGGTKWDSDAERQADRIIEDASGYNYDAGTIVHHATSHGWDASAAAREQLSTRSDGGAVADSASESDTDEPTAARSFQQRIHDAIAEFNDDIIQAKTARHYIAQAFVDKYHFVYPEDEVRGWRPTLYVYDTDEGVYEPRGEYFIEKRLEQVAGDFVTNTVESEIVGKVKRMCIERDDEVFRRDPERLVVGNGVLDLHTGTLDSYTPHEYHRTKIDIDWRPDAGEPGAIDEFFHDIVDDSDVDTLYRLIAHTIYKEYIGEKAAILIGSGENGKSVFLDFVEQFLGQYNVTHRELQDFSDDPYAINNLEGKLANLATEIGEQELADTTAFKKATGRDVIDAQVKYEGPVTFENFATLMFATNNMPVFGQDNHAIWRRWLYLEFPYEFSDDDDTKDPVPRRQLMRRLTQERQFEGLLVRCQQEIQRWYEGEELFAEAMDAEEVRSRMKKAAEPVYAFATDCLKNPNDDDVYEQKSIVRAAYQAFADAEELPRIADNEFGNRLLSLRDYSFEGGRKRVDGSRVTVYKRCQLSTRGRQVLGLDEPSDDDDQETVDNDFEQAKPRVLDRLADMVEENDGEPVSREALAWSVPDLGKSHTEQCIDGLLQTGRIVEVSGGLMPN